ncbi:MAG: phosphoribosyltransferase family protein, partial [Paracoccaceae bacterium]
LAPFSTYKPKYAFYSQDARAAAKSGQGHPEFWLSALVTSIYFTGLHKRIDYITVYPGHKQGAGSPIMEEILDLFGKCFRARYIPDMIVRHKDSVKSQTAAQKGIKVDHLNQLNTIKLNPTPEKSPGKAYAKTPLREGKTVLVVDDFCTRGHSLESARTFLRQTKVDVIMVSWLKTINTDFKRLTPYEPFDPHQPTIFKSAVIEKEYPFAQHFSDHMAPEEIDSLFRAYEDWGWPE